MNTIVDLFISSTAQVAFEPKETVNNWLLDWWLNKKMFNTSIILSKLYTSIKDMHRNDNQFFFEATQFCTI